MAPRLTVRLRSDNLQDIFDRAIVYFDNATGRTMAPTEAGKADVCAYYNPETGTRCVAGDLFDTTDEVLSLAIDWETDGRMGGILTLIDDHDDERIAVLSADGGRLYRCDDVAGLLERLQDIHDNADNWNEYGLNDDGWMRLAAVGWLLDLTKPEHHQLPVLTQDEYEDILEWGFSE